MATRNVALRVDADAVAVYEGAAVFLREAGLPGVTMSDLIRGVIEGGAGYLAPIMAGGGDAASMLAALKGLQGDAAALESVVVQGAAAAPGVAS